MIYKLLKNAIAAGGYKLADMQEKIKKYCIAGDLTDEQETELLEMAVVGVDVKSERPKDLDMLGELKRQIDALAERVKALEGGESSDTEGIEPWAAWDGLSDKYQPGSVVTHGGKVWESTYEGQNVWEPGAAGIDERFWRERTDMTV